MTDQSDPRAARIRDATARPATVAEEGRPTRNVTVVGQIEAEKALRESEARFRELADNISQFAWTADQTGCRHWYNKRWYDYTGTTLEEMQGWGWQKVHHPEHVDRVVAHIKESFETGTPWEDTFPLRGRDGNYRWFLSRALPIRNEDGEVVRWFGTNTDITEQIEAEQALRELNKTLEQRVQEETRERLQLWNVSQDLLVVADVSGMYLSVNPAWTTTLGWSTSELVGKTSQWLLHPDDREKTLAEISGLASGKKTSRFENRFRHKERSYRWISWKAAPDRGRIYAMGRDVTDLKEAENSLKETREELARGAQRTLLGAMSAAIAHEINQPLAAIAANASAGLRWLNRATPDLGEARTAFERVVANGHRASKVVDSVRGIVAKTERAETHLDIDELIRETIALARDDLEAAGIVVQLEMGAQLPFISAHKGQLQQVILNVVNNAADAMRAVTDRRRVLTVKCVSEADSVAVSVQDSGTGIDPKDIERIFDPFFTTKTTNMGIGLAISRMIVQAHGGRLSASPAVPHGSVFRIVLPAIAGTQRAKQMPHRHSW
jgi:PAS domain S-box-containing protein